MHHLIWHALLHAGVHLARHYSEKQKHASLGPACAKCGGTDDLSRRNCCGVILCESHHSQWGRLASENGYKCVICDKPCVFRD